ncbi:hypothetical protein ACHAQA_000994 [Verticillium albo-atrum]
MKDVVFVGLDIDTFQGYETLRPDQQLHVGLSTLDARTLEAILLDPSAEHSYGTVIQSHQFTIGESNYCRQAAKRFLFGTSQPITTAELKPKLEALTANRDIVLALHGANSDLKILRQLESDLPSRSLYIIDTNKAAQFPLQLHYRLSLEKMLHALQIPFAHLHAAGNDARFCLQALLMLAVRDVEGVHAGCPLALAQLMRDVAQAPRPPTAGEMQAPMQEANREAKVEKRAKREAKRAARKERRALRFTLQDSTGEG